MLLSSGSRKVRGLYLEGFGALFTLCVGFPLTAPPGVAAEPTEESSNPEWDQARKELHGEITPEDQANPYVWSSSGFAQVLYDAAKVDALNMQLLHTLKQASNVRNLKPDESVAVVVFGPVGAPSAESPKRPGAGRQQAGTRPTSRSTGVARNAAPGMNYQMMMRYGLVSPNTAGGYGVSASDSGTTTLSLRATKADVDAFALGKLGLEEFRQKVSLRIGGGDVPAQTPPGASPRPAVRSTR
jgi:hypothetical protein